MKWAWRPSSTSNKSEGRSSFIPVALRSPAELAAAPAGTVVFDTGDGVCLSNSRLPWPCRWHCRRARACAAPCWSLSATTDAMIAWRPISSAT